MSLLSMAQHFGSQASSSATPQQGQNITNSAASNPLAFLMGGQQNVNPFGQAQPQTQPQIQILQPLGGSTVAKNSALEEALVAAVKECSKESSADEALRIQGLAKRIGIIAEQTQNKNEPRHGYIDRS